MNNIGKLTTFSRLLNDESVIMIPKVQRDYAYGRKENKVEEVLDGMLTTMLDAVANNSVEIFDFVYGGSFVKRNDTGAGLIPLDGQQRLTTLFLLHWYASVVQPVVEDGEENIIITVDSLLKFRYETRQSATDFIEALIRDIRNDIIPKYSEYKNIKEMIMDNPKYLPSYDADPTIVSMLNVLEQIEKKCREYNIDKLWSKLTTRDNIQFYSLSLDKFGLTDDLYIKMNSRGKKLTEFEIFKSDLEKAIKRISTDLKDEVSNKIDNAWIDILWTYAQSCDDNNIVKKADDGFMQMFKNIFRLELFRRGIELKKNRQATIDEIITDEDSIRKIISMFDTMSTIQKTSGITDYWKQYFYFDDNVIGQDSLIRLFWLRQQSRKPVFYLAMDGDLSVPETVYFYTIYLLNKHKKDELTSLKCLRVIRNLVTANVRANSARYDMLAGFMQDAEEIVQNDGLISDGNHTFVSTACEEERYKVLNFTPEEYSALLKYENHSLLQGSLMLFINKYEDHNILFQQLEHFTHIFNNQSPDYFDIIRINLLFDDVEYAQYDPNMERDENMTRRYFIHHGNDLSQFFIKNERRRNQDAILDIIANKFTSLENLEEPHQKCRQFSIKSWQYYMAKYRSANREDTSYGCYAWDDKMNKPIEMVILNSSYHSNYNIEWKMLNHILVSELWDDNDRYSLDPHASSPFVMNKCGVTLSITQDGWLMTCNNENVVNCLYNNDTYSIANVEGEDNTYLVDFKYDATEMDYIDLAKMVINNIEVALESTKQEDSENYEDRLHS